MLSIDSDLGSYLRLLRRHKYVDDNEIISFSFTVRSEGGVHIDALLLPLSDRYVVAYATPIPNACDSSSTRDTPMLTRTTPSQRMILQATRYELHRNRWREVPFS